MNKMVVSLVGMVGCGKTTILNELSRMGYPIIEEGYMSLKKRFDNRTLISKWCWVGNWFNSIYDYFEEHPNCQYVITDRSALEIGIWTKRCYSYKYPLIESFREMEVLGYRFVNIYLHCDYNILLERINKRLLVDVERVTYNECNQEFISELNSEYEQHKLLWDYAIDTTCTSPVDVCSKVLKIIESDLGFIL